MRAEQVVELNFGDLSAGSGYLITSRHVLTAKHVVKPTRLGEICSVQVLSQPDAPSLPLSKDARPEPYEGRSVWISEAHDLAIVELNSAHAVSVTPATLGLIPRDELVPHPCSGIGFPEAARSESYHLTGALTWIPDAQRFNLSVEGPLPKKWQQWAGLSGCVVFSGGFPVGVVRTVDSKWDGLLKTTPIEHLLEDAEFKSFWSGTGLPSLSSRHISRTQATLLSQISAQIHRIDRKNTLAQVRSLLSASRPQTKPQVIVVPGLDEDEHRHLILMLSQDHSVQQSLGRAASGDNVIVQLPWPAEEMEIDSNERFNDIINQFARSTRLPIGPDGNIDLTNLRARLDQTVTPQAYWFLVRRAIAFQGHGGLLRRLLEFWNTIPAGRPVWLFLCLAWDEPVEQHSSLLSVLKRRKRTPDAELELALAEAERREQLEAIDELGIITGDHIGPWISELRSICRLSSPEQFDGLHVSMLGRIGPGKRLRHVAADLSNILPNI